MKFVRSLTHGNSPILEDVESNDDEHGDIGDEKDDDWQIEPQLANTSRETTATEQNRVIQNSFTKLFGTYSTPKFGLAAAE